MEVEFDIISIKPTGEWFWLAQKNTNQKLINLTKEQWSFKFEG